MSDDFQQRGGSPWGSPPGGGGSGNCSGRGPRPPDVDKIIKDFGGIRVKSISEGLKIADFVSLHMPLTNETKNLINN